VGTPIIVHTIHGMSFNRTQRAAVRWLYASLERYCGGFTDAFVCVAAAMARQAIEAGVAAPEAFVTIPSGIEVNRFRPELYDGRAIRAQLGLPGEAVVAATIARLAAHKGYEQLIPAVALAVKRVPRLHCLWIGDGPNREQYEQALASLGLRERVRLVGLVEPEAIGRLLAAADMLVHASRWEGLPRAAVQALLMARPAICCDVDGACEVVEHERTGLLVRLDDVEGLAEAICQLAGDPERRRSYGQAGRQLCVDRFDHRRMVDQIEKLYLELASRKLQTARL
jgi:glycosyltransferase involved in cell wall biosynthesis